jgi:release factor glutamine methyltransferase
MNLKALAEKFETELAPLYDREEAQAIFILVLQHISNLSRTDFILKKETLISTEEWLRYAQVIDELIKGKPVQYIIGETPFYNLRFKVNPSVLIPRPETEELVEWIIESNFFNTFSENKVQYINILDIGTGSGCIAITLKKNLPNTQVYAIDIAQDALLTAQQNANLNEVEVKFIQEDILSSQLKNNYPQFSIIVSNPPYITQIEQAEMHRNVLDNEPHGALFVSDEDPLLFYRVIADFALENLMNRGLLFFEINEHLGNETVQLLKDKGFKNIVLKKDMQGKDRMICAEVDHK